MSLGEYLGGGSANTKLLLHLNGSSADSSGNGNNGTDTNITYVAGKFGQCASFNGSSSKIALSSLPIPTGNNAWSCNMWIKSTTSQPTFATLFVFGNTATNELSACFFISNNIYINSYGGSIVTNSTTTIDSSGTVWYMVSTVWTGSVFNLYINGNLEGISNSGTLNIGTTYKQLGQDYLTDYFTGLIDEFIAEPRAWSAEEIKRYYTYSKGRFGII